MHKPTLIQKCKSYLNTLCREIPDRSVGSPGNRQATKFFYDQLKSTGWQVESTEFEAIDWSEEGAALTAGGSSYNVLVSPYSLGCEVQGALAAASTLEELDRLDLSGRILLLHGNLAKEQLMPKNFVFYNPEEHQKIIATLEEKRPLAIVSATGRNAALAGGVYPFPLIEDGDFDIPSVYMTAEEGQRLSAYVDQPVMLSSRSRRIPGKAFNILGCKGSNPSHRIVISAHIDAKKGTPGAIDNATGVVVLLLLAELLSGYQQNPQIELAAFNGEDYYSAPGQMLWLSQNQGRFHEILLNINIDGAGYKEGGTAFSPFELPVEFKEKVESLIAADDSFVLGVPWYQGDHSIFLQQGCPAVAVTSTWFLDNISAQDITHTPKDDIDIVNSARVVEIAVALANLLRS